MFKEGITFSCKAILPCGPLYNTTEKQVKNKLYIYKHIYQLGSGTT